jgi:hypothetical protein
MTTDIYGRQIIKKGTKVFIKTSNGGETIATLSHNYYPTYDVSLEGGVVIPSFRTTLVREAA